MRKNQKYPISFCLPLFLFLFFCLCQTPATVWADSGLLWLVNPTHTLAADYSPSKMATVHGFQIRPEAGAAYIKMQEDMQKAGITVLRLQSAYRAYPYQQALFDNKTAILHRMGHTEEEALTLAKRVVAPPGASEHQTGLAIDVSVNGTLSEDFGGTAAGIWLQNHCQHYGFIVRYPKEKTHITRIMYEPWHLRYVGFPHAQYMHQHNLCLEEYIAHIKEAGLLIYWMETDTYFKVTYCESGEINEKFPNAYDISALGPGGAGYIVTEFKTFLR